mmetsp:Transcript_35824/g.96085  ORF Transcript_35824/g.96085 Transcript_35824/m.96085 type:complete len:83 (-) Transcript_35824:324-572(-)
MITIMHITRLILNQHCASIIEICLFKTKVISNINGKLHYTFSFFKSCLVSTSQYKGTAKVSRASLQIYIVDVTMTTNPFNVR